MTVSAPVCMKCVHFRKTSPPSCDAFPDPDKIPAIVWFEGDPHTTPIPGDHGIQFEPKPEK